MFHLNSQHTITYPGKYLQGKSQEQKYCTKNPHMSGSLLYAARHVHTVTVTCNKSTKSKALTSKSKYAFTTVTLLMPNSIWIVASIIKVT